MISSTSIYVFWEDIPDIDRNGIITAYEVFYEPLRDDYSAGSDNATNVDNFFTIMELEEFAVYNISVRAYTSVGPGPYSEPIMNKTFEDG